MVDQPSKRHEIEKERRDFKKLLQKNPNYFGNLKEGPLAESFSAEVQASGNTSYEELHCVGLYPEQNLLEAVLEIKRPNGYSGDLCDEGSTEYVAFYIDWQDGNGFVSVGAPATVQVSDLTAAGDENIWYAVQKGFVPRQLQDCEEPQIVQVRAILSWQAPPTGPGYTPVWGNRVETWVQIKPKKELSILPADDFPILTEIQGASVLDLDLDATSPELVSQDQVTLIGNKQELKALLDHSLAAEEKKPESVEDQRHGFKAALAENPNYFGAISKSKDPKKIQQAVAEMTPEYKKYFEQKLAFDPGLLAPVEIFDPKTRYEELTCVGLYPELDQLEAIIEIKRPVGYKGDLCTLGSLEYVAFYVDWGSGWEWEGTARVRVHDIPEVDDRHLHYAVRQRISDPRLKNCEVENVVRVKAILSWETPPTGPFYSPTWGNALERHVQIRPRNGILARCDLEVVNEVHADDIQQTGGDTGYGIKISGSSSMPGVWDRPFGGVVAVWGKVNVPGAAYYRFQYTTDDPSDPAAIWTPVTDPRRYRKVFPYPFGGTGKRHPDTQGWFSVADYNTDLGNYPLQALVHWNTGNLEGVHHLRLELGNFLKAPLPDPCDVSLHLDNSAPELFEFGGPNPPPIPTIGAAVKDTGGDWKRCEEFAGQETVEVWGNFRDDHFRAYSMVVFGGNIHPSGHHFASGSYDPGVPGVLDDEGVVGAAPNGPGKQLETLDLCSVPTLPGEEHINCAYGIRFHVSDRAVVGYLRGYEYDTTSHSRAVYVTFNWDPNKGTPC